jgi:5-aminolevulinate synthase
MSRLFSKLADPMTSDTTTITTTDIRPNPSANKCPFLSKELDTIKEASPAVKEDIINLTNNPKTHDIFQYENFFHEQIIRKKKDHSYRYKKIQNYVY